MGLSFPHVKALSWHADCGAFIILDVFEVVNTYVYSQEVRRLSNSRLLRTADKSNRILGSRRQSHQSANL